MKLVYNFIRFKDNRLNYECEERKKRWLKPVNGLIKKFPSTYEFCNEDLNKFILLLRKGVYPYEYMGSWIIFNETLSPDKKAFNSELNLEDITDKDYAHAQKVFKELKRKNLGNYHDLYVQSDILFLQMCLKTLETSILKYMNSILPIFCLHLD